jgi:hypothetical protein
VLRRRVEKERRKPEPENVEGTQGARAFIVAAMAHPWD